MSCKNLILISLLLAILVLCGGAVSASQDNITTDELAVNEDIDIETSDDSVSEDLKDELNENILENTNDNDNLSDDEGEFIDPSEGYAYLNAFRTETGVWQWNNDDTTKTVFNTNSSNQLKPLIIDSALEETAKTRAKEMAIAGKMSHTRPDGSSCWTAFPDGLWAKGENIAAYQTSWKQVTESWKETNDPYSGQGHRRNMLNSNFNSVGIAGYKLNGVIYWAQDFGKYSNVADSTVTKPAEAFSITNNSENPEFKLSLPSDATGNFIVRVDGNVIDTKTLSSGKATITATGLTEGTHEALISYGGDSKYATIDQVVSFNVKKDAITLINTVISAPDIKMTYGDSANLIITLKDATGAVLSGKTVTVNLNGKKTYTTNANGQVSVPISLSAGNYTAYFSFDGDNDYNASSGSAKIEVTEKSNTGGDNPSTDNTKGTFTELNELIQNASENSLIKLDKDYVYNQNTDSNLQKTGINITKSLTIDGQGHMIDGDKSAHIFDIDVFSDASTIFMNINFVNATDYAHVGGAISYRAVYLTVVNCTFTECFGSVGAIYSNGRNTKIINSTFSNNSHPLNVISSKSTIENCYFSNNHGNYGGAFSGHADIINSTFINNHASTGGAIDGSILNIFNSTFINNTATRSGGAISCDGYYNKITKNVIINSTFINNVAGEYGGAISESSSNDLPNTLDISNCVFRNNTANYGGAISSRGEHNFTDQYTVVKNSKFENNKANIEGNNFYGNVTEITLIATSISASDIKMTYGDSANLIITLKDATGAVLSGKTVTVNLNGKKTYTTNANGQVSVPISLNTGTYTATFSFNGDDDYNASSGSAKIEVQEKSNTDDEEGEFVDVSEAYAYLNAFRTENGVWYWNSDDTTKTVFNTNSSNQLKPLIIDSALEETAKNRAKEMAIAGKMSHTRPDGSDCWTAYPSYASGENIANTYSTSCEHVTELWKETNDPYSGQGHRRNMLSSYSNAIGIAGYKLNGRVYWAQSFGRNSNLVSPTTIKPAEAFNITNNTENPEFILSLPSDATGNFIVRVDGKLIDTKTLSSGKATITATGLTEGTHEALISYGGDSKYATIDYVVSFNVKKDASNTNNTNTNTPTTNNQNNQQTTIKKQTPKITAKKATFKAKKKIKKYIITLKVGKKAVKKVWVTLKIKGKTIKAKTNNKGQAVFKITLKKKGTYKAKISFEGDKNYKAVSKKVTIKIK